MRIKRYIVLPLLLILLIISQTGCSSTPQPVERENYFLDTTCKISIYDTNEGSDDAEDIISEAWKLCSTLDKTLSKTVEVSDVSKINSAGGEWVEVSDYTIEVLKKGIYYSELSGGIFDVTIGTVTALWDFHTDSPSLPDQSKLDEALRHVDYTCVQIDDNKVRLTDPAAQLDLGGIAKGYIADKITEFLESKGVNSGIVNLGGNVVAIGSKTKTDGFTVGIEKPYTDRTELIGSVEAVDQTVVTSGVYERQFELNGKEYHHILSTSNGYPVETDLDSITLIADKGLSVDIDAMSTICLILGSKAGKEFIEKQDGIKAVFCKSNGKIVTTKNSGFEKE